MGADWIHMAIPNEIEDKLDSDPSWAVQHEEIVRAIEESKQGKPWSRYMVQQHLDGDPAKKTVQDRLDELVELEVLDKYEYTNQTLYDLAYDPIVTDGGRLRDANMLELATLRDRNSLEDLLTGLFVTSGLFLGAGLLTENTELPDGIGLTGNFYLDTAFSLYAVALALAFILTLVQRYEDNLRSA